MAKKHIETVLVGAKDLKDITDALVSCGGDVKHFTKPVLLSMVGQNPLISTLRQGSHRDGFILLPIGKSQEFVDMIDECLGIKGTKYLVGICSAESEATTAETLAYILKGEFEKFLRYSIA